MTFTQKLTDWHSKAQNNPLYRFSYNSSHIEDLQLKIDRRTGDVVIVLIQTHEKLRGCGFLSVLVSWMEAEGWTVAIDNPQARLADWCRRHDVRIID